MQNMLVNTIKILSKTENLFISSTYVNCSPYRLHGLFPYECYCFTKFYFPTASTDNQIFVFACTLRLKCSNGSHPIAPHAFSLKEAYKQSFWISIIFWNKYKMLWETAPPTDLPLASSRWLNKIWSSVKALA